MVTPLRVLRPGCTACLCNIARTSCLVENISIEGQGLNVKYYVVWWEGAKREGVWVNSSELEFPEETLAIEVV